MGLLKKTLLAALVCNFASLAQATVLFSDNFNRADSNTVGNGWVELEDDADDVAIWNNSMRLRDTLPGNPDAASTNALSTAGYTDIILTFDWAASNNTEPSDDLYVDWSSDGINYTTLFHTALGGSGFESVALGPLGIGGHDPFYLRFWTDVSTSSEWAAIDNVVLSGTAVVANNPSTVPEPGTLALFGLGILGFAGARRFAAARI